MRRARTETWGRLIGLSVGLAVGLAFLVSSRVPQGGGILGASLRLAASSTGELAVNPSGTFLSARLVPGADSGAQGTLEMTNQTGSRLLVRLRALPSDPDLDHVLRVEITAGNDPLFLGDLAQLRSWTEREITIARSQRRRLKFRTWIPAFVTDGYQARVEDVRLQFKIRPVED